jgi:hypothetical protein
MYGDEQMVDEDGNPIMGGDPMGDGQYEEEYGAEDDESMNFENMEEYKHMAPLDRMRKIRRTILKTINDIRAAHKSQPIMVDYHANKAANEYALWLLQNPEDPEKAEEICKAHGVSASVDTKYTALVGFAMLEEEEQQVGIHE